MKILAAAPSFLPADTAHSVQVMKACAAMAELGHDLELLVPARPGDTHPERPWPELAAWYGIQAPFKVRWQQAPLHWKRYDLSLEAARQAASTGADLLYTWMPQAAVFGLLRGLPVALELHDRPTGALGPLLVSQFARQRGVKRLAVISRALRRALEEERGIRLAEDEWVIAPNGVELERYASLPSPAAARAQLGLPERLTGGYTGHFYAGRGLEILLALAQAYPQAQFLWVGGQPGAVAEWRERLAGLGIQNVILTGYVENRRLPLYQAAADILLMPYARSIAGSGGGNSADICSPMKMFEYLAAGRAILSSDLPVLREVLDERTALFAPPEDPAAWARLFGGLLQDEPLRERLAQATGPVIARYTWTARQVAILRGFGA